jgi:hyperosmotically inducible protein
MKRLTISLFLCLILTTAAFTAQDDSAKPAKKPKAEKAAPPDCSTVTDAAITDTVKDKLSKAPSLKEAAIRVETREGIVTLTGKVKTVGLKGVATRMTKRVDCVKKVDNQLSYEQGRTPSGGKKASETN